MHGHELSKYRQSFMDDWFSLNGKVFFGILVLLYLVMYMLKRMFIIDQIAAFEILQQRGEMWIFDLFFGLQYLSIPVFLAWKFTLTAFLLWVGCFLFGYRITFAQMWKVVMLSELIFLVPELLKVLWFILFQTDPTYQDFVAFYPLSLIHFFDYQDLAPRWHYPLKALNVFEVIYWLLLTAGIYWVSGKKLSTSKAIVGASYILFFLLWLGFYLAVYR